LLLEAYPWAILAGIFHIRLKLCQDELRGSKESGSQNTTYKQGYVKVVVIPKHPTEQYEHR